MRDAFWSTALRQSLMSLSCYVDLPRSFFLWVTVSNYDLWLTASRSLSLTGGCNCIHPQPSLYISLISRFFPLLLSVCNINEAFDQKDPASKDYLQTFTKWQERKQSPGGQLAFCSLLCLACRLVFVSVSVLTCTLVCEQHQKAHFWAEYQWKRKNL